MLDGFDSGEHYRSVAVAHMKQAMRYGPETFKEDWNQFLAIITIMAGEGESEHMNLLADRCMMRIEAYLMNNPEARPWDEV